MISVIIPTLFKINDAFFLKVIEEYLKVPDISEIIIIDNTVDKVSKSKSYLKNSRIKLVIDNDNLFVNPAWNYGVSIAENEYVVLANDDIFCRYYLFDKIKRYLKAEGTGIVTFTTLNCIYDHQLLDKIINRKTITSIDTYISSIDNIKGNDVLITDFKRKGMLFAFKKENWVDIPDDLIIWAGDDYIYMEMVNKGLINVQIYPYYIYHHDGGSKTCDIYKNMTIRNRCLKDEQIFKTKYNK